MALIHVVIPVYNAKPFLRDAVRSVLEQPCKDIEIILVNDGSTDGSAELCNELANAEPRISVIHQKNQGVSVARNTGIDHILNGNAEGYIAFLDADDAWYPNVFTSEMLERLNKVQSDVFVFDAIHSNPEMTRFSKSYGKTEDEITLGKESIWKIKSHFGALLYPVCLFRNFNIRFKEGLRYSEDEIFRMQCVFLSEAVQFCKSSLYIYRNNRASAMGRSAEIAATDYFLPIIDGWILSDDFINNYSAETGRNICAGRVLAGIYLLEMAIFHFQQGRPRREIMSVLYNHPHFCLLQDMRPQDVSVKQYKDSRLLLEKTTLFQLKYLLIGFAVKWGKQLRRIPAVAKWEENRRYPFSELPQK